jgi:putative ABC transport system permease protein
MILGVAAVIAMVALGTGAKAMIEAQVMSAGTNLITIQPGFSMAGGAKGGGGSSTRLVESDAKLLRDIPQVAYVSEIASTRSQLIYGNQNWQTSVEGANVDLPVIRSWQMQYGTFFSEEDVRSTNKVLVLGANVADQLFGEGVDPTDQPIRVRNHMFKILGVMARKGASGTGQNQDDQVFAPYTTVMKRLSGQQNLNRIYAASRTAEELDDAAAAITAALRVAHEIQPGDTDDFMVQTLEDVVALRTQATSTMTSLLAALRSSHSSSAASAS